MRIFYPDGRQDLKRTTHLAIGAHQDDLEIMALDGIGKCYKHPSRWFCGVTCTSGAGSARQGKYAHFNDEQMAALRACEQEKAAKLGRYGAMIQLGLTSAEVKEDTGLVNQLKELIEKCSPQVIYTHNLLDKHSTHVAVAKQVIAAVRQLEYPLDGFFGCEVWRGLDWLGERDKVAFDLSGLASLSSKLLRVYKSQIAGGKAYDLATEGRMRANATYFESHAVDQATHLWFGLDYKPLLDDKDLNWQQFVRGKLDSFGQDLLTFF